MAATSHATAIQRPPVRIQRIFSRRRNRDIQSFLRAAAAETAVGRIRQAGSQSIVNRLHPDLDVSVAALDFAPRLAVNKSSLAPM
jgi:hypothetical protein